MNELRIITAQTLDSFVSDNPYNHYQKTSLWATHQKEKSIAHYLGYFQNEQLVATAMLLQGKSLFGPYIYLPQGPCVDYENIELSTRFFNELINYVKELNCIFLRTDPNVIRVSRDIQGNATTEINHEYVTEYLQENGFVHKGYGYAYNGSWSNRYTLVIDLSPDIDTVVSRFTRSKQNVLKRQLASGIKTRIADKNDLEFLMRFEAELAHSQKFKVHSKQFFEKYLTDFGTNAHLYLTELYTTEMIACINEEINSGKYKKDPEALGVKEKELARAVEWQKLYGDIIPLAAGLFVHYGYKSWDLYTYSGKQFNSLKPTDNLHYFAINDLKKAGVSFYDMCGFSGVVDKNDRYYGLYDYKRSFGSQFIEYIGEFDYVYKPFLFRLFNYLNKIRIRIKYYLKKIGIY